MGINANTNQAIKKKEKGCGMGCRRRNRKNMGNRGKGKI